MTFDQMKRIGFALCFGMLVTLVVVASGEVELRTVTAIGISRQEAVINGLIEAVRQTKGVSIDSTQALRTSFQQVFEEQDGQVSEGTLMTQDQAREILTKAKGYIKSYKILSNHRLHDGTGWEATIQVEIPRFKSPGITPQNRRRLAVMPTKFSRRSYSVLGQSISGREASRALTKHLVSEFTQSRRFAVLDRENIDEFVDEKQLILSGNTPLEEQVKLGQVMGADYLVISELTALEAEQIPYEIQLTNQSGVDLDGSVAISFRIVVMATRQVKWSDTVALSFANQQLLNLAATDTVDSLVDGMLHTTAAELVTASLNNIYPIRIVAIESDGQVVLNEGGTRLTEGQLLDVYSTGELVYDPYTKEPLGPIEKWAGMVKIMEVMPKMSYARIVQGDPVVIGKDCIVRRSKQEQQLQEVPQQKTREGVRLPFD